MQIPYKSYLKNLEVKKAPLSAVLTAFIDAQK